MPMPPLRDPNRLALKIWSYLRGVVIGGLLGGTLLVVNLLQTLSLVVKPFSGQTFRRLNRFAANTWWGWCVLAFERVYGFELKVSGDAIPMRENAVVFANHQQMTDIILLLSLARSRDRLGDIKWFVKHPIKFVPGVGWGMVFLDAVFVKRDWAADRQSIAKTFAHLTDNHVPLWLILFPEGTRFAPHKLGRSHSYALEHGLHAPDHTLLPRVKGFVASMHGLRQHADAVYDVTIIYKNGVPTLWQYLRGFVDSAELHVRRYPMSELPQDDAVLSKWLYERFADKDRLLGHTYPSLQVSRESRSRPALSFGQPQATQASQPDSP